MKRCHSRLVGSVMALALIAAGCGGGDDNSDSTTTSLTKAEWLAQADADLRRRAIRRSRRPPSRQFGNQKPSRG